MPIPPERVLEFASKVEFKRVMVIRVTADGDGYFAMSDPDGGTALWDMDRFKHALMVKADERS